MSPTGVFGDVLLACTNNINKQLDDWVAQATPKEAASDKALDLQQVFGEVAKKFNEGYLNKDEDESHAVRSARFELGKTIKAERKALDILKREVEKCKE